MMEQYLDTISGIGGVAQDDEPELSESGTSENDEDPEVLVESIAKSVEEQTD
jgi:hypothetical protein